MARQAESLKVLYITGNGHSGSTLLDIMLGSTPGFFSAGELTFITRKSIKKEYCSCGELICDCKVWSQIWKLWDEKRAISYEEYQKLQLCYERNKTSLRALRNRWFPEKNFLRYCDATAQLFQSIQEVTGAKVIIDSSKTASRIAVLERIADVTVIHLCRNFKGVLNSAKKSSKKNIKAGIEEDNPAKRTDKTLFDWIINNALSELFCLGVKSYRLMYRDYIQHPDSLSKIHLSFSDVNNRAPYAATHMLAGNVIRLKKELTINPQLGFLYKRLNPELLRLATWIDRLFWFWG